ncbi:hypothetical protein AVEN_221800-1 [Araneus ventricosus]|uniref:EGF-like domain-containing protein n=1 Tax=Araneus ventricosus TaxID=182803 RepID=A0A4Y2RY12_ARAVE|nr:hypothetical protein AVEN_221800-1 [Araneus ventricosus]
MGKQGNYESNTKANQQTLTCDCGLGGSCHLDSSGDKICYCFSGYARYKGHCYDCDCGPYGTCIIDAGIKRCICDFNYAEKNGKCECCGRYLAHAPLVGLAPILFIVYRTVPNGIK